MPIVDASHSHDHIIKFKLFCAPNLDSSGLYSILMFHHEESEQCRFIIFKRVLKGMERDSLPRAETARDLNIHRMKSRKYPETILCKISFREKREKNSKTTWKTKINWIRMLGDPRESWIAVSWQIELIISNQRRWIWWCSMVEYSLCSAAFFHPH